MDNTVVESKRTIPEMRKVISILTLVFFLAMSSTIALADVVPGALLYLDAADNPAYPDAWTNLGTAGGELPACDEAPELETGEIEIPALTYSGELCGYTPRGHQDLRRIRCICQGMKKLCLGR